MPPLQNVAVAVLVALSTVSSPAPAASAASPIVGHWYGEGWQPYLHQNAQWIDDFRADGTFTMTVRMSDDCKTLSTLVDSGTWSYANNVLTMVTTTVGAVVLNPPHSVGYRMTSLTARAMDFTSNDTATAYHVTRVAADFKIPSCLTS